MDEEVSILKARVDHARTNFEGSSRCPARISGASLQQPFQDLSRRRFAPGLGIIRQTFRRASVLGRPAGTDSCEYRRDQDGTGAWPRERHRLQHAAAVIAGRTSDAWEAATQPCHATGGRNGNEDTLQLVGSEPARAATRPRMAISCAASMDRHHKVRPGADCWSQSRSAPIRCSNSSTPVIPSACPAISTRRPNAWRLIRPILAENNRNRWAA